MTKKRRVKRKNYKIKAEIFITAVNEDEAKNILINSLEMPINILYIKQNMNHANKEEHEFLEELLSFNTCSFCQYYSQPFRLSTTPICLHPKNYWMLFTGKKRKDCPGRYFKKLTKDYYKLDKLFKAHNIVNIKEVL